jgi:hypothetical protein
MSARPRGRGRAGRCGDRRPGARCGGQRARSVQTSPALRPAPTALGSGNLRQGIRKRSGRSSRGPSGAGGFLCVLPDRAVLRPVPQRRPGRDPPDAAGSFDTGSPCSGLRLRGSTVWGGRQGRGEIDPHLARLLRGRGRVVEVRTSARRLRQPQSLLLFLRRLQPGHARRGRLLRGVQRRLFGRQQGSRDPLHEANRVWTSRWASGCGARGSRRRRPSPRVSDAVARPRTSGPEGCRRADLSLVAKSAGARDRSLPRELAAARCWPTPMA